MNALWILLPAALVGALVQYALPVLVRIPAFLWRTHKGETAAEGIWYSYHFTREGHEARIRQTRWKMKLSVKGSFSVICWGDKAAPRYKRSERQGKGTAFRERGFLVITAGAKKYHGHWTIRILDPIEAREQCVPGLWLSFDFDHQLIAGPIVFSQDQMSLEKAESHLLDRIMTRTKYRQLGLQPRRGKVSAGSAPSSTNKLED